MGRRSDLSVGSDGRAGKESIRMGEFTLREKRLRRNKIRSIKKGESGDGRVVNVLQGGGL